MRRTCGWWKLKNGFLISFPELKLQRKTIDEILNKEDCLITNRRRKEELKMKNTLKIDFDTKTIIMDRTFAKKVEDTSSDEYLHSSDCSKRLS